MKLKIAIVSVVLGLMVGCSSGVFKHAPDVRNVHWGMSKDEVIAAEDEKKVDYVYFLTDKMYPKSDELFYKTKLDNIEVLLVFIFDKDKLTGLTYAYDSNTSIGATKESVSKFMNDIEAEIKKKYGEPVADKDNSDASKRFTWTKDNTIIIANDASTLRMGSIYYGDKKEKEKRDKNAAKPDAQKL